MSGRANTSGDEVTRRAFLRTVARSCLGVSALPFLGGELLAGAGGSLGPATARSVLMNASRVSGSVSDA